jgi:ABC-type nitrate/sulfonate/bicarbonate transport system permease component
MPGTCSKYPNPTSRCPALTFRRIVLRSASQRSMRTAGRNLQNSLIAWGRTFAANMSPAPIEIVRLPLSTVFNTYRGIREVDPILIKNARMLGASNHQLARHVLVPSALTWIFSSLHISVGMAIIAVVVGEYLGASRGIGYLIAQAEGVFDTTGMFAGVAVLAVAVLLIGTIVGRLERRLLQWNPAHDSSQSASLP